MPTKLEWKPIAGAMHKQRYDRTAELPDGRRFVIRNTGGRDVHYALTYTGPHGTRLKRFERLVEAAEAAQALADNQCPVCKWGFMSDSILRQHMREKHDE